MYIPKSKHRPWDRIKTDAPLMENRSRIDFYHTTRWKKESRLFRQQNPLCRRCQEKGFVVPSEVTDHKVPLEICEDPWNKKNWDPLCKKCNNTKAAEDKILIQQYRKNNPK